MVAPAGKSRGPSASTGPRPARRSTRSTPRRPPCRARSTPATCARTRTPTSSLATSACAAREVFYPMGWDDNGLHHRAAGAALLRRHAATRHCPTTPTSSRRTKPREARRSRSAARTSSSCAPQLTVEDRGAVRGLWPPLGLSVDWTLHLHAPSATDAHACSQRAFLRTARPRRRPTSAEAPTLWDVDFQTAVAQAELEDREIAGRLPPAHVRTRRRRADLHRDHAARAARRVRRARRPSRRRALPAAVRHRRCAPRCSASRCRSSPTSSPTPRRASGIAMICTFGDTTDVVWWRELDLPVRAIVEQRRPHHRRAAVGSTSDGAGAPTTSSRARRRSRRRSASSSCCSESGDLDRRAAADHPRRSSSGRTARARSRSSPTGSGSSVTRPKERAARARPGAALAARLHARPLRELGRTASSATGTSPGSGSSACRSRSGTRSTPTATPTTTAPIVARRERAPGRSVDRRARRLHDEPARPARRLHRRSRRHGHVGHVVADAADRRRLASTTPTCSRARLPDGPAPAGARHHPHVALLHDRARSHYEFDTLPVGERRHLGLRLRPRPQEAVEVGGQRPMTPLDLHRPSTAPTPSATGPPAAARAWTSSSTATSSRSAAGSP